MQRSKCWSRGLLAVIAGVTAWAQQPPAGGLDGAGQPPLAEVPDEVQIEQRLQLARQLYDRALADPARNNVDFAKAVEQLESVLKIDPTNLEANLMVGEISMDRRDYNNARGYFKKVLRIQSNNFRANYGMAKYYMLSRVWRQAVLYLKEAERVSPPDELTDVLVLLSQAYMEERRLADAKEVVGRAIQADPSSYAATRVGLAVALAMEELDTALEQADRLIKVSQQEMIESGLQIDLAKRFVESFDVKVEVLKQIHNSLHRRDARNQVTDEPVAGKETEIAEVLLRIAETRSNQMPYLETITYIELLPLLQRAIELAPSDLRYRKAQANVMATAGMGKQSLEAWREVLRIAPGDEDAQRAVEFLQSQLSGAAPQGQPQPAPAGNTPQP